MTASNRSAATRERSPAIACRPGSSKTRSSASCSGRSADARRATDPSQPTASRSCRPLERVGRAPPTSGSGAHLPRKERTPDRLVLVRGSSDVDVVMRGSQVPGIVSRRRAWCTPPMSAPNPPPPQRAAKALRPRPRAAARAPRDRRDGLDVHPQRLALVVFDADHVHVGQPDEQRAHARSVGLHRGSGGWTGVGTSDSGAPAPHPRTPRSANYPTRKSEEPDSVAPRPPRHHRHLRDASHADMRVR